MSHGFLNSRGDTLDCPDPCEPGLFQCSDGKVVHHCELGEGGCWSFAEGTECDDLAPCTDDVCDPEFACLFTGVEEGTPCDDENICTEDDVCAGGLCAGVESWACADGNDCTIDGCAPVAGCVWTDAPNGTPCGDDKGCLGGECVGCVPGSKSRCWVECSQVYPAECLGGNSALIMGVETCEDSQWGACATKMSCLGLQFPCVNGNGIATDYECLDGTSKTGTMTCFKPLGIDCETSFYSGWGPGECQDLCIGPGDTCDVLGQDRTCEVHCDFGTGETKQGSQTCDTFCDDNKVWGPCMTDQACNE